MCSDLMEGSIIDGENDCENNAWSATDPEKMISSINEALKCMLIETRSKFDAEQKMLAELLTIQEEIKKFHSNWEGRKITLASKLEELIRALTETET
ncbi:unnamed protein product [Hymenolepis diminuta]|uniref:Uncharacterized protein n=1 Tax=Hymenolepis diminuta TaxID=6216 RepID=A0A564YDQ9_HYMDI|nr:unnamed protein product [Hymenolepis diminuta]